MELLIASILTVTLFILVKFTIKKRQSQEDDLAHLYTMNNKSLTDIYGNKLIFDFNTKMLDIEFNNVKHTLLFNDLIECKIKEKKHQTDTGSMVDNISIDLEVELKSEKKKFKFYLLDRLIYESGKDYRAISGDAKRFSLIIDDIVRSVKTSKELEFIETSEGKRSMNCTFISTNILDGESLNIVIHQFFSEEVQLFADLIINKVNTVFKTIDDIIDQYNERIDTVDDLIEKKSYYELKPYIKKIAFWYRELESEIAEIENEIEEILQTDPIPNVIKDNKDTIKEVIILHKSEFIHNSKKHLLKFINNHIDKWNSDLLALSKQNVVNKHIEKLNAYRSKLKSSKILFETELKRIQSELENLSVVIDIALSKHNTSIFQQSESSEKIDSDYLKELLVLWLKKNRYKNIEEVDDPAISGVDIWCETNKGSKAALQICDCNDPVDVSNLETLLGSGLLHDAEVFILFAKDGLTSEVETSYKNLREKYNFILLTKESLL